VPPDAKACPGCGADEETGWSEKARYDSLGIPTDDDFDYDEFTRREFSGEKAGRKLPWLWTLVALALLLLFLGFVFRWAFLR
jgi:hypothetical protein